MWLKVNNHTSVLQCLVVWSPLLQSWQAKQCHSWKVSTDCTGVVAYTSQAFIYRVSVAILNFILQSKQTFGGLEACI